ncbi:hypothetical protein K2X89_06100 [Myxococcota bacterium]|nr:hypothetical protein [Myxococcota bacterium]
MSTLARALEASGIATVALISNRKQAESIGPPRGLFCEFPLGRPLGRPLDPALQHRVLAAAFALLPRRDGPLLADFDVVIEDEVDAPLTCPIPPRLDPKELPAVAEARALRPAYDRGLARIGTPQVGRVVDADGIPEAIRPIAAVAEGAPWQAVAFAGGDVATLLMDIRAYYETAALGLEDGVPAARASESWYHRKTQMGALLGRFFAAVKDQKPPFPGLFYLIPMSQTDAQLF